MARKNPPPPPARRLMTWNEVSQIVPIGRSTWFQGVKEGRFPPGVKLGSRLRAWWSDDIERLGSSE